MMKAQKIMRILRESRDYSQEYVANILDMNQKTYSNLESGKTKLTLERINQLAEFYQVKPEYFLGDELPTINYNTGSYSRSIIGTKTYNEANESKSSELFERIIAEKDVQIDYLINELKEIKKEKENLLELIKHLGGKIKSE
ncbi:helix-turn-helix transcriptional regulator [Litoribacter alkaliphilus]|uniref:Helix-turn-helix transcriptional regulator n=1 Tax=Litoribacter ruber TaxID=702568 RepID=A0AAP2CLU2_9BACT|nr:helix-turn-helix transcriptional regulator [Litoribacter alkaliphilus]MBS9525656.1 helix-turn-helix transcriptional regulator [Litoribacter alkaliphilus]